MADSSDPVSEEYIEPQYAAPAGGAGASDDSDSSSSSSDEDQNDAAAPEDLSSDEDLYGDDEDDGVNKKNKGNSLFALRVVNGGPLIIPSTSSFFKFPPALPQAPLFS